MKNKINLGIDATNLLSGGAVTHLAEILANIDLNRTIFKKIIIWGYKENLKKIKKYNWLIKKYPTFSIRNYFYRFLWHLYILDREAKKSKCQLLFIPGGIYLGSHKNIVTLFQNMLPFDFKEVMRYAISLKFFKLILLRFFYKLTFEKAKGIIFLTQYAKNKLKFHYKNQKCKVKIIPHGINKNFFNLKKPYKIKSFCKEYKIIYLSSIELYKHHNNIIRAISMLNKKLNLKISLHLVGPCNNSFFLSSLNKEIEKHDPNKKFIKYYGNIAYNKLPIMLKKMDLGVFASSCENLPISLIEKMASGLPIACSNKKPMTEILERNSVYFNPENVGEIYKSILTLLSSNEIKKKFSKNGILLAKKYSWKKTSKQTFKFLEKFI
jgi:glycosyltransferase involved in cell wall biosynthesis